MTRTVWCLCATAFSTKFSHIVNPDDAEQCDACVHCAAALSTKFSHIFNPDDAEQCDACVQQPCLPSFTTYLIRMTLNCVWCLFLLSCPTYLIRMTPTMCELQPCLPSWTAESLFSENLTVRIYTHLYTTKTTIQYMMTHCKWYPRSRIERIVRVRLGVNY